MLLFPSKNFLNQRYSRQKGVDRVSSDGDSLATRLLQLTALWTTCVYYTEITAYTGLSILSHFLAIIWFTNSKLYRRASLATHETTYPLQKSIFWSPASSASVEISDVSWRISFQK